MFSSSKPEVVSVVNGNETYGDYRVIRNMEDMPVPSVKAGDLVYLWWSHEKSMEFITASGIHFFVPHWQVDHYLRRER